MKKVKLSKNQLINAIIIMVLYLTWIISSNVVAYISNFNDYHLLLTNLFGSILALVFAIILFAPLIPCFSKLVNSRVEDEVVKLRRSYSIKMLYTIIIGFFIFSILWIEKINDGNVHPVAANVWGTIEFAASLEFIFTVIFSIEYFRKTRELYYMDKLQHSNEDIQE